MHVPGERVALLGDLVGSRDAADRRAVHDRFVAALGAANAATHPLQPASVTVGDECQGVYATVGGALEAAHRLRLELAGASEVRVGLGVGSILELDAARRLQDGPAWWEARAAIEAVEREAATRGHALVRTGVRAAEPGRLSPALLAAVRALDVSLARLDAASARILLGIVGGARQAEIAAQLDLSAQAVSQRVNRHGLVVLAESLRLLWREP